MSALCSTPTEKRRQVFLTAWLPLLLMAFGCWLCGKLLTEAPAGQASAVVQWTMLATAVMAVVVFGLWYAGKMTWQRLIFVLLCAGFVLRIAYALYTGYTIRAHDVSNVTSGNGHMGYIQYIAHNLSLPDSNRSQFYHPPLHHILAALVYRVLEKGGMEAVIIAEKLQFLTMFYSCATMVVCDRLFAECKLSDKARALADAVIVFHPSFLQLGGDLNNDMLALLLACCSVLFFVKWWNDDTRTGALALCGLFLGLSMMTKISGVMLAFPYAVAFLRKLWEHKKRLWPPLRQYLIFGFISVPIGMWYPIRNLLLFKQALTYVPRLSDTSSQYIGNYSALQRLFTVSSEQLASPYQEIKAYSYNIPLSMFKTSLFGEAVGSYSKGMQGGIWAHVLFVVSVMLAAIALIYMLMNLKQKSLNKDPMHAVWTVMWASLMFSYVLFCFKYPHVCSQDFRYLVILVPVGALYLGKLLDENRSKLANGLLTGLTGIFCFSSAMVYALPMIW